MSLHTSDTRVACVAMWPIKISSIEFARYNQFGRVLTIPDHQDEGAGFQIKLVEMIFKDCKHVGHFCWPKVPGWPWWFLMASCRMPIQQRYWDNRLGGNGYGGMVGEERFSGIRGNDPGCSGICGPHLCSSAEWVYLHPPRTRVVAVVHVIAAILTGGSGSHSGWTMFGLRSCLLIRSNIYLPPASTWSGSLGQRFGFVWSLRFLCA